MKSESAGRLMDAEIAEHLGLRVHWLGVTYDPETGEANVCRQCEVRANGTPNVARCEAGDHQDIEPCFQIMETWPVVPEYSTSVADAWTLVERLYYAGYTVTIWNDADGYEVEFWKMSGKWLAGASHHRDVARAICESASKVYAGSSRKATSDGT